MCACDSHTHTAELVPQIRERGHTHPHTQRETGLGSRIRNISPPDFVFGEPSRFFFAYQIAIVNLIDLIVSMYLYEYIGERNTKPSQRTGRSHDEG